MQGLGVKSKPGETTKVLTECIDRALEPIGKTFPSALYFLFKMHSGLDKTQIPLHPMLFSQELKRFLGNSHFVIEKLIIEEVGKKFVIPNSCTTLQAAFNAVLSSTNSLSRNSNANQTP
ncbi:MAG: hypothetical protein JRN15_11505 [Nitrososphaerota archaeon]|nr:hypothetical protein [Nitrososphaerota archaeon]